MAKRSIDKQLLSNYLRHADGHNKIQEEQEMWRVRSLELKRERIFDDWERKIRQPPLVRGRLVSDTLDNDSRGYSGSTSPSSPDQSRSPADVREESRGLCKQLMRQEERDPFRWGHTGFKELYPDEFASSEDERSREGEIEKRKERKSHSRKRKREHKDKRKTKRQKLKKSGEGKSEASSKKKRQKAKKKRRERRRDGERESTTSDSDCSSHSEVEELDRKREKKRTSRHKRK